MLIRLAVACIALAAAAHSHAAQTFGGCPVFPADNYWNTRVDSLAVHPSSAAWVNTIGASTTLHPDFSNDLADGFGFNPIGVTSAQQGVPIFYYPGADPSKSDPGPYPIPPSATGGVDTGDREVTVTDTTNCILFEFFGSPQDNATSWITSASAKWSLRSNALRPEGWESGDHAGLPFLAGLMRWEEVAAGEIGHAIRITARNPSSFHVWPARHGTGTSVDTSQPPMGARFRLKASFDISGFDARTQVVLRAFKQYGMVLASGGGNWFMQGVSNTGWPDVVLGELRSIAGSNFEAVDTAPMIVDVDSGQAVQPTSGGGGGGGGGGGSTPSHPEDNFPPGGMPSGWIQPAGSSAAWVVANDASYGGTLSLKSGFIGDGQKSEVSVTRGFAPGSVSFARKVSSQASDALEFAIDGVVQARWSGEQDWAVASFAVPAGPHTLTWRYVKDASGSSGADAAWIDGVTLPQAVVCLGRRCSPR